MDSLIAYIAQEHGLGRENLATELLAHVLRSARNPVLRDLFAHFGLFLSSDSDYRVHVQQRGKESRCIPDIQVQDEDENTRALIESKFQAGFTRYQPNSYLKEISKGDLLLFVVPESRRKIAFERLSELCRSSDSPGIPCNERVGHTRTVIDGRILEVTSWEDTLKALEQSVAKHSPERQQQRLLSDIEQLRRFCKVADIETFSPLTPDQIRGIGTSTLLRHLSWITRELITQCINKDIVQPKAGSSKRKLKKNEIGAGFDSSPHFGQNLRLCGIDIWMGFWPWAWEDHPKSPLWVGVYPRNPQENRILKQLQVEKGETFAFPSEEEGEWLIPIPIKPDILQDEVVAEAFGFVSDLKRFIERATSGSPAETPQHRKDPLS